MVLLIMGLFPSLCVQGAYIQALRCEGLRLDIVMQRTVISLQAICGCMFRPGNEDNSLSSSHVKKVPTVDTSASPACSLNGSSC